MDEEDLFSSGRSQGATSKLGAIFAQDNDWQSGSSASLSYKSAKPPPKAGVAAAALPPSVAAGAAPAAASAASDNKGALFAAMVSLISYDSARQGTVVGPRALALMRHPSGSFLLLAYAPATPNQPDVVANVNETFTLMPQAPSYAFFYVDDQRAYWCVQLASEPALTELARLVAMAKHAANPQGVSVVTQDLVVNASEPRAISNGDAVKASYKVHALSSAHPRELGPLLATVGSDDKPKQLKLGAGKELVGLEQGMVGMKKGGKRVLILPASLAYGAAGNAALGVPPNAPLLIEVELLKVKHADKPQAQLMAATTAPTTPIASAHAALAAAAARPGVIVLGGPSSETPSTPDTSAAGGEDKPDSRRNSLMNRMAAMGAFAMPNMNPLHQAAHLNAASPQTPSSHAAAAAAAHSAGPETIPEEPVAVGQQQQMHAQPMQPIAAQQQMQQPLQQLQQPLQQYQQPPQQLPQQHQQPQQQQQMPHPNSSFQSAGPYGQQPYQATSPLPQYGSQPQQPQQQQPLGAYGMNGYQQQPLHSQQQHPQPQHQLQPQLQHGSYGVPPGGLNPSPMVGASSVQLQSLETKLEQIQSQLARCLGTGNAYDPNPTLNGAQMLKGLTALLGERDDAKARGDKAEEKVAELAAKITAMQERHETYLAEERKLSEGRYSTLSEELKLKNANITQLQDTNRALQHDVHTRTTNAQELELKAQKLTLELELAQGQVKSNRDLERQVALLTVQLEESKRSTEHSTESVRASMGQELVKLQQEAAERAKDLVETQQAHQKALTEAQEATAKQVGRVKELEATVDGLEKELASARNDVAEQRSANVQREQDVKQLQLRLEHQAAESSGNATELAASFARQQAEHQAAVAALQAELEQSAAQLAEQTQAAQEAAATAAAEHAAALSAAVEAALEQGKSDTAALFRPKLADVVAQAKTKIESMSAELEEAASVRAELEAQVAAVTDEKNNVLEQSKLVIAKIRTQIQAQQQEHEDALAAAVATADAQVAVDGSGGIDAEEVERVWQERVKKAMAALFQTLAGSLARSSSDSFSRAQLRELLMRDIKNVTIRALAGEEGPVPVSEDEESEAPTEAHAEAAAPPAVDVDPSQVQEDAIASNEEVGVAPSADEPEDAAPVVNAEVPAAAEEAPAAEAEPPVAAAAEPAAESAAEPAAETAAEPEAEPAVPEAAAESVDAVAEPPVVVAAEPASADSGPAAEVAQDASAAEAVVDAPAAKDESVDVAAPAPAAAVVADAEASQSEPAAAAAPVDVASPEPEVIETPASASVPTEEADEEAHAATAAASSSGGSKNKKKKNKKKAAKNAAAAAASAASAAVVEGESDPPSRKQSVIAAPVNEVAAVETVEESPAEAATAVAAADAEPVASTAAEPLSFEAVSAAGSVQPVAAPAVEEIEQAVAAAVEEPEQVAASAESVADAAVDTPAAAASVEPVADAAAAAPADDANAGIPDSVVEDDFDIIPSATRSRSSAAVESATESSAATVAASAAPAEAAEPAAEPAAAAEESQPEDAAEAAVPAPAPAAAAAPAKNAASLFDDDDDAFGPPPAAAAAAPVAAAAPPAAAPPAPKKASSLFGDDDDDDLFPMPAAAQPKPAAAATKKSSLFDDDDF